MLRLIPTLLAYSYRAPLKREKREPCQRLVTGFCKWLRKIFRAGCTTSHRLIDKTHFCQRKMNRKLRGGAIAKNLRLQMNSKCEKHTTCNGAKQRYHVVPLFRRSRVVHPLTTSTRMTRSSRKTCSKLGIKKLEKTCLNSCSKKRLSFLTIICELCSPPTERPRNPLRTAP